MRTSFSFDDDKHLVQLARTYIDAGARIAWKDVARRMRPAVHPAAALRQRLKSLFRTWGRDIARFPASFFTEVCRPRGRPPAITQQLRSFSAHSSQGRSRQAAATAIPATCPAEALPHDARQSSALPRPSSTRAAPTWQTPMAMTPTACPSVEPPQEVQHVPASPARVPAKEAPPAVQPVPASPVKCRARKETAASAVREAPLRPKPSLSNAATPSESLPRTTIAVAIPVPTQSAYNCDTQVDSAEANEPSDSKEKATVRFTLARPMLVLSSLGAEEAVASMFADVSAVVVYNGGSSHLNVGEVLPSGVTTLLREIGDVDANDVFFDIGAGLGNVIAQVVLASKVSKAIGVELRADAYRIGREMIARSPHGRYVSERAVLNCVDITGLPISCLPPYKQATIVFWSNILFEPVTIDFVKRELSEMLHARVIVCTSPICPRHLEPCFSAFCSSC